MVTVTLVKDEKQYNNVDGLLMAKQKLPPFDEAEVPKSTELTVEKVEDNHFIKPRTTLRSSNVDDEISVEDIPL